VVALAQTAALALSSSLTLAHKYLVAAQSQLLVATLSTHLLLAGLWLVNTMLSIWLWLVAVAVGTMALAAAVRVDSARLQVFL
jgi:hypothetical protein